ncbi:hypothetical protein GWK47_014763 [Chionoecetes opilio]|uniref:Uncharacterized protein n=1 Tax=Chionoecetes opilio TaxID=41210 RepID=A0A8J4XUH0_CHIOP|nr:hypothetical protein GWK47_014763 [Chionoecetes opilio]
MPGFFAGIGATGKRARKFPPASPKKRGPPSPPGKTPGKTPPLPQNNRKGATAETPGPAQLPQDPRSCPWARDPPDTQTKVIFLLRACKGPPGFFSSPRSMHFYQPVGQVIFGGEPAPWVMDQFWVVALGRVIPKGPPKGRHLPPRDWKLLPPSGGPVPWRSREGGPLLRKLRLRRPVP